MESKMAALLEADLAQSASYEQTGGVVNGTKGGCAWVECVGGGLRVGRGIILCSKAMVLDMTLLPLGKMSISLEFHFWPETPKKSKMAEMSMFCTGGLRHVGLRGRILRGERKASRSAGCL